MGRALVVGGNGFLGAHLVDALAADGWQVDVFDRFSTAPRYRASAPRALRGTFSAGDAIREAVAGHDLIIHALSATTPAQGLGGPQADVQANLLPTLDLLGEAVRTGVGRVLFISSGGTVYGSAEGAVPEDAPLLPISPYGIGKVAIEHYLHYFAIEHGLPSAVLRVANPYGLRADATLPEFGLVSALLRAAAADGRATRLGDGSMVRDYLHVDDVVAQVRAVVADPAFSGPLNIGSGVGRSVQQIIEQVRATTGAALPVDERPAPASFVEHIVLDTSRFATTFGQLLAVPLAEGIERTWRDWRR
ncbi:UDP-glucose 4-epimerase [Agrococcus baldri]|uniref:UDP-glucose 4-epimerase n=1 Tax=Agrococcus baldri TaxID=153730 RepID=A0AA94KZU2_9MICO|nr:NAD-dependent epimerase/dehydratase family protein [Agrococcus baldri]SFS14170.1 UDP-glucose 4-epimerase [Agrococcus baldri]